MNEQIRQKFCLQLGTEQVLFDEPMKKHTTFRIGGPADVFVMPRTIEEVSKALEICRQEQLPYFILGNGSNLLVSDQGYRGVIIQLDRNRWYRDPCSSGGTSFFHRCGGQKSFSCRL